ncbi:alanyl-tRNA editing protein [Nereida sp. MMG025]|uniref:alanyl-tRNA editing protein n=1 Tax=Nereida sp. MMG025 TaxID=2909981 RepID=UPI001F25331D|nr:alanyl-tRNA editing protein [Nereida sp. MMG025]MCF6443417.1 alanyl-tRNA editing protein [Nereida sp. MMG025]
MTEPLFLTDAYLRDATGKVVAHTEEGGIVVDQTNFYATGGGQPGDSGVIRWQAQGGQASMEIATCVKGSGGLILIPAEPVALPPVGGQITQEIHWDRRHRHMRVHTLLHLLSVVIPLPVTGGAIGADKGRLDFAMPEPPEDKAAIETALKALIEADHYVTDAWITERELEENPALVKTMSVQPPKGAGVVRLVRIGDQATQIDLQPCGGTHVERTGEIGAIRLGKIEKKGKINRRVYVHLEA